MHVHVKPIATPQTTASHPVKPAKAKTLQGGTDIDALLSLSGDRRDGTGSQSRHPPGRQDDGEDEGGSARLQPAASLAVLLTVLHLDRSS